MTNAHSLPNYDINLQAALEGLGGYVPVGMTLGQLDHFRSLSSPSVEQLIGDKPINVTDHVIPGHQGADIVVSVLSRSDHRQPGLGVYHIHGGGMVMGNRFAGASALVEWVMKHDAVCVTVEYRLAPEHPAPTPVEDCYAGLEWMSEHADALLFGPERIVIFGGSGGGGLAAGTTLLARDRHGPKLMGQLLQCPMLDDRNTTASALQYDGVGVWDTTSNRTAWNAVLGERYGGNDVSPYSAPARAKDLSGLPPTYIDVGAMEVFRDEDVAYANGIWAAAGSCELHVWGDAFHGFYDIVPKSPVAQACIAARDGWLVRLLAR